MITTESERSLALQWLKNTAYLCMTEGIVIWTFVFEQLF